MRSFKKKWAIICAMLFSNLVLASQCEHFYPSGIAPIATNSTLHENIQELCSKEYVVMYSGKTRTPLWSAEHLTRKQLARKIRRVNAYRADTRISPDERSESRDYIYSGFDRGHLAPSEDASNSESQRETFLLSNMVPQNADNNRQQHAKIESAVRQLVQKRGSIFVFTGTLFMDDPVRLLNQRVMIPTHIYKLVYDPKRHAAAAYLEKNAHGSNYRIISASELNNLAGINFFPNTASIKMLRLPKLPIGLISYSTKSPQ